MSRGSVCYTCLLCSGVWVFFCEQFKAFGVCLYFTANALLFIYPFAVQSVFPSFICWQGKPGAFLAAAMPFLNPVLSTNPSICGLSCFAGLFLIAFRHCPHSKGIHFAAFESSGSQFSVLISFLASSWLASKRKKNITME